MTRSPSSTDPQPVNCPCCGGEMTPDSDYPDDLLCGFCEYVYDRETLDFVEAFGI